MKPIKWKQDFKKIVSMSHTIEITTTQDFAGSNLKKEDTTLLWTLQGLSQEPHPTAVQIH